MDITNIAVFKGKTEWLINGAIQRLCKDSMKNPICNNHHMIFDLGNIDELEDCIDLPIDFLDVIQEAQGNGIEYLWVEWRD